MTVRVAVVGAAGRMGSTACAALTDDPRTELVAGVGSDGALSQVLDAGADVAVELTTPTSVVDNTTWLLERGVHVVVGASGVDADGMDALRAAVGPANCLVVPNFSVGAVLLMRFAALAARHLPDVEITEAHHPAKVDAPSGTALRTAEVIDAAGSERPDLTSPQERSRGLVHHGVPIHSQRLPGVVAAQQVVFGGPAQTLTLRHDSLDRSSFMPGLLLAVTRAADTPGLTVGLDTLLA